MKFREIHDILIIRTSSDNSSPRINERGYPLLVDILCTTHTILAVWLTVPHIIDLSKRYSSFY
ncbi:MAG: hypothetical protein ACXAC6_14030 [Candidatus Hodarchaeales archaeon]